MGCISLLPGCFYIAPVEVAVNQAPEIVIPTSANNQLTLIADIEKIDVYAFDPDDDELLIVWSGVPADIQIPPDPPLLVTQGDETLWLSTYEIPRDPVMDGRTVRVEISDIELFTVATWAITVEE